MRKNPHCLYFEDLTVGEVRTTTGRTITETDIVQFAGVSGDYNPIHTDEQYAKSTPFGGRIAHGLLVLSVTSGLVNRLGFTEGSVIAFIGLKWRYVKVVKIGDTLFARIKTQKKKDADEKSGIVIFGIEVLNQREEIVQKGEWTILVAKRIVSSKS